MNKLQRMLAALMVLALLTTGLPLPALAEEAASAPMQLVESVTEPPVEEDSAEAADAVDEPAENEAPAEDAEATAAPIIEATAESTDEPSVEPSTEPSIVPSAEPTDEPAVEPSTEATIEPTLEPAEEPSVEPSVDPTVEPTVEAAIGATVEPFVAPENHDPSSSSDRSGSSAEHYAPAQTVEALAYYMDMSVEDLAEALEMSMDDLAALSPEEIAALNDILRQPVSTYANGGGISLGRSFSGNAHTSYTLDYSNSEATSAIGRPYTLHWYRLQMR